MTPKDVISRIKAEMQAGKDTVSQIGVTYQLTIDGEDGGVYRLCCVDSPCVEEGEGRNDCEIKIKSKDLVAIAQGSLNPQTAFLMGKLKVQSGMQHALKLSKLLAKAL